MKRGEPSPIDPNDHPLRQYRHRHGWSLGDAAKHLVQLGYDRSTNLGATGKLIGRWERGECKPRKPYPDFLCLLYGATPVDLGLAPSPTLVSSGTLGEVDRRRFLHMLTGAAAAPILIHGRAAASVASQAIDADRLIYALKHPSSTDMEVVSGIVESIAIIRRLDDARGARYAVESALHQRTIIQRLLKDGMSDTTARQRLLVAAGELSQFLASLARDMNDPPTARRFLDEALSLAHETDANELRAYILGCRSILEVDEDQPREALAFIETARNWADVKGTPATRACLALFEAEALAPLGDRRGTEQALERSYRALAQVKADQRPPWLYWLSPNEGGYGDGKAYVALGLAEPARRGLNEWLATRGPFMARDRACALVRLGETYVLDKEVDETCRVAGQALTIATSIRSDSAVTRVRKLRAQLESWAREPAVRHLDEQLAAASV